MSTLPVLEGEHIFLRQLRPADAESLARHADDKEISRFITHIAFPYTSRHATSWIKKAERLLKDGAEHHYGICETKTDGAIGVIGLKNINRHDLNAELEYWIGRTHRNCGKTTQAIRLILDYAFGPLGLRRVYAVVHERNIASVKVLEKTGFTREGTWREASRWENKWGDVFAYGILKAEHEGPA